MTHSLWRDSIVSELLDPRCEKCNAGMTLLQKIPAFRLVPEVRVYECSSCHKTSYRQVIDDQLRP